ncbi:MAG: cation:proton antiporter [Polyangiales bacterium]
MDTGHAFLTSLSVVLCVAAVTTVVFQSLRQPVVLGYLLAGLLVGPQVRGPLSIDPHTAEAIAELGVILLMFSLGLEFSLRKLLRVGASSVAVALIEVGVVAALGFTVARALGWTSNDSMYTAGMVAISSSTIVTRVFRERRVEGQLRDLVFGVLIVEDLVAILALATFSALSSGRGVSASIVAGAALRLVAFLVATLTVGMLVVPRVIRLVLRLERPETTVVASVGLCFASSLLARHAGYSVALGAFLAGALVAESGEGRTVESLVEPVRDMFAAVFFVAVGMQIDPSVIVRHAGAVASLTAVVVVGKVAGVTLGAFLGGHGVRRSLTAGVSLGQIGEFSFIIAALGVSLGAVSPKLQPVAVAVSAITTMLTPWMVRAAEPFAGLVDRALPAPLQTFAALYGQWIEQLRASSKARRVAEWRRYLRGLLLDVAGINVVAIVAARFHGTITGALVRATSMPEDYAASTSVALGVVVAVPFFVGGVRVAQRFGNAVAEEAVPMREGGVDLARSARRMLAATFQLAALSLVCAAPLLVVARHVPVWWAAAGVGALIVLLCALFWARATDLDGHVRAVVQVVIEALASQSHSGDESRALAGIDGMFAGLGVPVALRVEEGAYATGRTLAELDLRGRSGATVLVLQRGEARGRVPVAHESLAVHDVLVVAGATEAIERARRLLATGAVDA